LVRGPRMRVYLLHSDQLAACLVNFSHLGSIAADWWQHRVAAAVADAPVGYFATMMVAVYSVHLVAKVVAEGTVELSGPRQVVGLVGLFEWTLGWSSKVDRPAAVPVAPDVVVVVDVAVTDVAVVADVAVADVAVVADVAADHVADDAAATTVVSLMAGSWIVVAN